MADDGFNVDITPIDGLAVQTLPNGNFVVVFKAGDTVFGYGLNEDMAGRLVERLLMEAAKVAETRTPTEAPKEITANPVPVAQLGIGPHPTDPSAALLAIRTGGLRVTFQADLSMLFETLSKLDRSTTPATKPVSH